MVLINTSENSSSQRRLHGETSQDVIISSSMTMHGQQRFSLVCLAVVSIFVMEISGMILPAQKVQGPCPEDSAQAKSCR